MIPKVLPLLVLTLLSLSASRPAESPLQPSTNEACLQYGTWGNDWPLCGGARIVTEKSRGEIKQRLEQELKLTFREDGTGEMSFYFCPIHDRIAKPVQFSYQAKEGLLTFQWRGTEEEVFQLSNTFQKNTFRLTCSKDTLFVDSLLQNTMYRGASYFVRRQ